jgi:Domain of unknown function (DUF4304)
MTVNAGANLLGELVGEQLSPFLKQRGFKRSGLTFERDGAECICIIEFQRSAGDAGCERFNVNLGIASKRLLAFEDRGLRGRASVQQSHWRTRLGRTLETPADVWWELCVSADVARVSGEVQEALERHALPLMEATATDAALRAEWAAGRAHGITEFQRLQFLSVLLDDPERREEQALIAEELREFGRRKGLIGPVAVHLERLGLE